MDAAAQLSTLLDQRDVRGAGTLLVRNYMSDVFGLCLAMVRNEAIAEELSQDVFSKAFGAIGSFRGESSPRTWILKIARNRAIDYLRSVDREPWGADDESAEGTPAEEASVVDLLSRREELKSGLALLSEGERALIMLRFGHGLAYGELAETFGLSVGAVRMRLSRAVAKIREQLSNKTEPGRARRGAASGGEPMPQAARPAAAPSAPGRPPAASAPPLPSPSRARPAPAPPRSMSAPPGGAVGGGGAGSAAPGMRPSPFVSVPSARLRDVLLRLADGLV